jgi:hypothetical protein
MIEKQGGGERHAGYTTYEGHKLGLMEEQHSAAGASVTGRLF